MMRVDVRAWNKGGRARHALAVLLAVLMMLGTFAVLALPATGVPDDPDGDKDPPEEKSANDPVVKVEKNGVLIDHEFEKGEIKESLHMRISSDKELDIHLTMKRKDDRGYTSNTLKIEFEKIVFFMDKDGDGKQDVGEEVECKSEFKELKFKEPYYSKADEGGKTYHIIEMKSEDHAFKLKMKTDAEFKEENGDIVPPTFNLQIRIQKPYECSHESSTSLTLKIESDARVGIKSARETSELGPTFKNEENTAETVFTYSEKASVDGNDKDIHIDEVEKNDVKEVTITYPEGKEINHDLAFGALPAMIVLHGDLLVYGATIGIIAAIAVMTEPRILRAFARKP